MTRQNDGAEDTLSLYVWLARNAQGIEGIVQVDIDDHHIPLVFTDRKSALAIETHAAVAGYLRSADVRLVQFDRAMTIKKAGATS